MAKLMQAHDNNVGQWRVPGAREVAVRIEGMYAKPRDWIGNAQADEDLVGMVILLSGSSCSWVKSAEQGPRPQIRVLLSSYDDTHRDVQIGVGVGGAAVCARCLLPSTGESFEVEPRTCATGAAIRLLQLSGEPSIEAFALLLSRSDVRFGRNRLWRLRDELLRNVNEPLRSVLSRGRTGHL